MIIYASFSYGIKYDKFKNLVNLYTIENKKINKFIYLSLQDISKDFIEQYKNIFYKSPGLFNKGLGYWLWKPYLINKLINEINDEDILLYSDIDHFPNPNLFIYDKFCTLLETQPIYGNHLMTINCSDIKYTKKELINYFNITDEKILNSGQMQAGRIICNIKAKSFVKKWLDICCTDNLITDILDISIQNKMFKEHRHDQSIFSILNKINGYIGYNEILKDELFLPIENFFKL